MNNTVGDISVSGVSRSYKWEDLLDRISVVKRQPSGIAYRD
jgi:hypothetical protein